MTLYGSDNDIYRDVCGVENGFTRVDEGIQTLKKLQIPVEMVSTVIRQNQDDVRNMAFYAFTHKIPWMATGGIKDSCRGADSRAQASERKTSWMSKKKRDPLSPGKGSGGYREKTLYIL